MLKYWNVRTHLVKTLQINPNPDSDKVCRMTDGLIFFQKLEESTTCDLENARQVEGGDDDVFQIFGINMEELKEKVSKIDDLQQERDNLSSQQHDLSAKIQSLEESLKNKNTPVVDDDVANKLLEMEEALKERETKLEEVHHLQEEKIKHLEIIKTALQEKVNKCADDVAEFEKLQHACDEKEGRISKLQKELEESVSKQKELENHLNNVSESMTDDEKKLKERLLDSRKELAEMTEK